MSTVLCSIVHAIILIEDKINFIYNPIKAVKELTTIQIIKPMV